MFVSGKFHSCIVCMKRKENTKKHAKIHVDLLCKERTQWIYLMPHTFYMVFMPLRVIKRNYGIARIFYLGGGHPADATRSMPPGRCHPADATQPCTHLKLARAAVDLWAFQQSVESWVEPRAKKCWWNDIWGGIFYVVSLKYIGKRHLVITYTLKERNNIN